MVSTNATQAEIKSQYRKLVKEIALDSLIGDLNQAKGWELKPLIQALEVEVAKAEETAKQVNEAYETLSDSSKKAKYDQEYFKSMPPHITFSQSSLNFGHLKKGETRTLSFQIKNIGGPANSISIQWKSNPSWATQNRSSSQFPIMVIVKVTNTGELVGMQSTTLNIVVNDQTKSISVSFFAVATEAKIDIIQNPIQTTPAQLQKVKSNTGYPKSESESSTNQNSQFTEEPKQYTYKKSPAQVKQDSSTKWYVIIGTICFACAGLILLALMLAYLNQDNQNKKLELQIETYIHNIIVNPPVDIYSYTQECPNTSTVPVSKNCQGFINTTIILYSINNKWDDRIYLNEVTLNGKKIIQKPINSSDWYDLMPGIHEMYSAVGSELNQSSNNTLCFNITFGISWNNYNFYRDDFVKNKHSTTICKIVK